ncbi:LytR family transcriptional regulator [Lactobacillus sp. PV037]|uniref:LCP family protein n=1 Tax=unclassified Lactobacillus TaxID=2620435 RepID=UPI0022401E74|nr:MULTISPECIES: LCP family protein [unclassified Lactobacillus]QNQ82791.1 LytR family transcriptional regulator [Lactobacillus sp. PV012]QNQ83087.1 LytR family transcriptional regulator [Lactobacillus sp. PV037]
MQPQKSKKKKPKKLKRNSFFAAEATKIKKGKKFPKFLGLIGIIVLGIGIAYFVRIYFAALSSAQDAYHPGKNTSTAIINKKPISILILGVDQGIEGRHDRGNSDTMILATLNPQKQKATMTSIPRDLLVDVQGDGKDGGKYFMFRINSAYQVGGSEASAATVSKLLNTPVDYTMEVQMDALKNLVDALGGVDVKVPFTFTYNDHFKKGWRHLSGSQALNYVRMRHDDPRGDYGRQKRQRQVIQAIVKKGMNVNVMSGNYRKILKVFSKYVRTNLTADDMTAIAMNYRSAGKNVKSGYIQGHDAWIGDAAMQVAPTSVLQHTSDLTRTNLDLSKEKLENEETRQNKLQKDLDWKDPSAFENYVVYDQNSDTIPYSSSSSK